MQSWFSATVHSRYLKVCLCQTMNFALLMTFVHMHYLFPPMHTSKSLYELNKLIPDFLCDHSFELNIGKGHHLYISS